MGEQPQVPRQGLRANRDYAAAGPIVARTYGRSRSAPKAPAPPQTINVDTVAMLTGPSYFSYRGMRYRIRKVPWWPGVQLDFIAAEIAHLMGEPSTREHMAALVILFEQGFAIMWRLTKPRGWWWRGRWRNPFDETMTYAEFQRLVSFFSECQMRLPDLALDIMPGSLSWMTKFPKTLRMAWHSLPKPTRTGVQRDSRSVITTIGLDSGGLK